MTSHEFSDACLARRRYLTDTSPAGSAALDGMTEGADQSVEKATVKIHDEAGPRLGGGPSFAARSKPTAVSSTRAGASIRCATFSFTCSGGSASIPARWKDLSSRNKGAA